jgi:hypothetical protein
VDRPGEVERIEQSDQVGDVIGDPVAGRRHLRVPVAAQRVEDRLGLGRQWHAQGEGQAGVVDDPEAVDEHDDRPDPVGADPVAVHPQVDAVGADGGHGLSPRPPARPR